MWIWETENQPKAIVVIVHNVLEHHRRYAWVIEYLRSNDCHVVMGDLPSHGEAAKNKGLHNESIDEYELYLERAIEYASQFHLPIFLLGHGFGATTILHYMRKPRESVAGLLLTSPWIDLKATPSKWSNRLAKLTINQRLEFPLDAELYISDAVLQQEYQEDELVHTTVTTEWYEALQERMKTVGQSSREWTVPVWLQLAAEDKVISVPAVRTWMAGQKFPTLHYSEWTSVRHDIHQHTDREFVAKSAIDFIHLAVLRLGYVL